MMGAKNVPWRDEAINQGAIRIYSFDETSGTTLTDYGSDDVDGTYDNVVLAQAKLIVDDGYSAQQGDPGTDGHLASFSAPAAFPGGVSNIDGWSNEAWAKWDEPTDGDDAYVYWRFSSGGCYLRFAYSGGTQKIIAFVSGLSGAVYDISGAPGALYHIVQTVEKIGSTTYNKLYVGGTLRATTSLIGSAVGTTATTADVGLDLATADSQFTIDGLAVYDSVLDSTAVSDLFAAGDPS
jgi:hypothetical protein